jgi:hypothetical protein
MKVFIWTVLIILLIFATPSVYAASCTNGSLTLSTTTDNVNQIRKISGVWVSKSDGNVDGGSNCDIPINGYIVQVVTDPGATAPTDNYDIVLNDSDSMDIMGGRLQNRDTSNSEQEVPLIGGTYMPRYVNGSVSLDIDNAGNAKGGTIIIYVWRES